MNRQSRLMARHASGGIQYVGDGDYTWEYPKYLEEEYLSDYDCSPSEFAKILKEEVANCMIPESEKKENYKLWFGKYKGEFIHDLDDEYYLTFITNTFRNKNKNLVGQALLRLKEIRYSQSPETYPKTINKSITQYDEHVYVWFDETGNAGGATPTLDQAKFQLEQYAKFL